MFATHRSGQRTIIYLTDPKTNSPQAGCDYYPNSYRRSGTGQATRLFCYVLHRERFFFAPVVTIRGGELLPRHFTLTVTDESVGRFNFCDTICRHRLSPNAAPTFIGHTALRCSDFPLTPEGTSDHLRFVHRENTLVCWILNSVLKQSRPQLPTLSPHQIDAYDPERDGREDQKRIPEPTRFQFGITNLKAEIQRSDAQQR